MAEAPEFYAMGYSKAGWASRDALPQSDVVKLALYEINDCLMINPDKYAYSTEQLKPAKENRFVYKHPNPPIEITYQIDQTNKRIMYQHFAFVRYRVKTLFICYSPDDQPYWDQLKKYLLPLEREDKIMSWFDDRIRAADIRTLAKAVLLLVTQNLLTSPHGEELPELIKHAKEENLKILWIAVSSSSIERDLPEIKEHQPVHKDPPLDQLNDARRKKAFVNISDRIIAAMKS